MKVEVSAPSNIALIKYMGKTLVAENRPTNSSLSWTLESLRTHVTLTYLPGETASQWKSLSRSDLIPLELSSSGQKRYLKHLDFLKKEFNVEGSFLVESANNFPSDCGLASSASSFAALTMAAVQLFQKMNPREIEVTAFDAGELSRKGSGSSCRSFFGPWAIWDESGARPLEFPVKDLWHQVVVVEGSKKEVSSSEAHQRVSSSSLFDGRPQRAEKRLADLIQAFQTSDWERAYSITWEEFWDMHVLFETSRPSFGYMQPKTLQVLSDLRSLWQSEKDGPIVTMDAGANVHLLYRADQKKLAQHMASHWGDSLLVYSSQGLN